MRVTRENSGNDQTGRVELAGAGGRLIGAAGVKHTEGHGDASDAVRGLAGCRSTERTAPAEIASMRAATRMEGPRSRNRSFRTMNGEISPMRSATSRSDKPSDRIQSLRSIAAPPAETVTRAAAELPADRLADALAVMMLDLVQSLAITDRGCVLERLANRLDDRGRTAGGGEAALLLGRVGGRLDAGGVLRSALGPTLRVLALRFSPGCGSDLATTDLLKGDDHAERRGVLAFLPALPGARWVLSGNA